MFTKKQIREKIKEFNADIESIQSEVQFIQTDAQTRINQKIAELNRITGKKDVFEEMLKMVGKPEAKKVAEKTKKEPKKKAT